MAKKETKQKNPFRKWIIRFWLLIFSGIAVVALIFFLASVGAFGEMPTFEELENPKSDLATQIISVDNKVLGKFFKENRTPVFYKDLPKSLVDAFIATEDERYFKHAGIDVRGTIRAFAKLGKDGGASTVTQQLAKNLFHKKRGNIIYRIKQKFKEWVIAVRLEKQYTKNEIIAMYFNTVDFNYNGVGIQSATRIYFGKEPKDLTIEESAMIVAMLKNPTLYNPVRRPKLTTKRREVVLSQMKKQGALSPKEYDSLRKLPLQLNFTRDAHDQGTATYFREYVRKFMKNLVRNDANFKDVNIYTDGLKVYTTIDSRMQKYAENAVAQHMPNLQKAFFKQQEKNKHAPFYDLKPKEIKNIYKKAMKTSYRWKMMKKEDISEKEIIASFDKKTKMRIFAWNGEKDTIMTPRDSIKYYKHFLNTGVMSVEPQTGEIRVWVGGINFKHFQYDHVKQGARQVGSTFKPFVYGAAINQLHLSPCDSLPNMPYTIEAGRWGTDKAWTPDNAGGKYGGKVTLKEGLARSLNTISAQLIDKTGPQPIIDLAKKLGVKHDIPYAPSIALGTPTLSLYEMIGALSTFANKGIYIKPHAISRIEDKNGTILWTNELETKDAVNPETAYVVLKLMEGVTQSGSGGRLRHSFLKKSKLYKEVVTGYPYELKNPIAGKTGTTQNQSDGWFMGIVPNLATGIWVGGDNRATHFKSISYGQGATMALPIFGIYLKSLYADKDLKISDKDFSRPANLSIRVDCGKGTDSEGDIQGIPVEDDNDPWGDEG
jgi:penicillin-binding protein 1A